MLQTQMDIDIALTPSRFKPDAVPSLRARKGFAAADDMQNPIELADDDHHDVHPLQDIAKQSAAERMHKYDEFAAAVAAAEYSEF